MLTHVFFNGTDKDSVQNAAEMLVIKRGANGDLLFLPTEKCQNQLFVLVNTMDIRAREEYFATSRTISYTETEVDMFGSHTGAVMRLVSQRGI